MEPLERYKRLRLRESLSKSYNYASACNELGFLLKGAYNKVPKNLQAIMFQDTLGAFRALPEMLTDSGIAAANLLLQSAEVTLPKQKRALAVTEFKHAIVAYKRRCKAQQNHKGFNLPCTVKLARVFVPLLLLQPFGNVFYLMFELAAAACGSASLPQDILVHIFRFLDMRSLVAAGLVCRYWNSAARDNMLWQSQHTLLFGDPILPVESEEQMTRLREDQKDTPYQKTNYDAMAHLDWREAFKKKYLANSLWRSTSNRGYCWHCRSILWISDVNFHHLRALNNKSKWRKIKPLTPNQVVAYIMDGNSAAASSDSDSDSDRSSVEEQRLPRLWAYSRRLARCK